MPIPTEKKLLQFRQRYIEWGNILIPYGPSKKFRGCCYHLPSKIEIACPNAALDLMIEVYQANDIPIGRELPMGGQLETELALNALR